MIKESDVNNFDTISMSLFSVRLGLSAKRKNSFQDINKKLFGFCLYFSSAIVLLIISIPPVPIALDTFS